MTLEEFGATLRGEREKRHLTIENVAEEIKINTRMLGALEAGDLSRLPPPAYARGFIRTYSAFLGLGEEEIRAGLDAVQKMPVSATRKKTEPVPAESIPEARKKEPREKKSSGGSRKGAVFLWLCAALIAGGVACWHYGLLGIPVAANKHEKITSIEKLPDADAWTAKNLKPEPEEKPHSPEAPAAPAVPEPLPLPETAKIPPVEEKQNAAPENEVSAADAAPAEVQADAQGEQKDIQKPTHHKLVITATEECWVHSNADKTDTRQFSLRKGDTFALTFAKNLELKLGNAGGVRLLYDGQELPPQGASGQVRTISFPPK